MAEEAEWVTCPYERSHRVPALRIQRHLVKCEERYPPLAICPYNATHRMPHAQLAAHVQACPTRAALTAKGCEKPARAAAALTTPHPTLKRDYMAKNDPDDEQWD
ncbi:gametocyte-specific factor 1-like isoform X2 [Maniola jurtina]|uniref:gametocyte-specific factor 1-like isoform X1 n=1 Tax=Maniola jurtina TaxID=191418 RepID=UPI001E68CFD7|nr:gametocyte-specific factor 1-like isoform X1 [Maniola jurtina]XP_045781711.1 gametocyte-specific factor 1-like isoform X2 [Maniola jurtina]